MKYNGGYTLIELLIAFTIASLLSLSLTTLVVNRFVDLRRVDARANMQIDARNVLEIISRDIEQSASVDPEERWSDANELASPNNWASDADTLILATPAYDDNKDPLFEDPNLYITYKDNHIYYLSNGNLYRRILADPVNENAASNSCPPEIATGSCRADTLLASNIVSIEFNYQDSAGAEIALPENARSVKTTLVLSQEIFGVDETIKRSIETVMRN